MSHHAAIGARPPASRQNGRSGETSNVYRTFSADLSGTTYRGYLFTTTAQPPTAPYMEFT